ncbi:hypothetical protein STTU_0136 [Streptomyces sp. Tu6071]|nr:hypothetical protein STTU_0136 [Streptomyces sp. Tu6071]
MGRGGGGWVARCPGAGPPRRVPPHAPRDAPLCTPCEPPAPPVR